jgi:hypothetical protein
VPDQPQTDQRKKEGGVELLTGNPNHPQN